MRRKLFPAGVAIAAVALGASTLMADVDDWRGRGGCRGPITERLELTVDQRSKMEALWTKHMKAMARLRADVQVARLELDEVLRQKDPGERAVKEAAGKLSAARARVTESRALHRAAVQRELTEEQFQKLRSMRGPGRGGPGHGRGPMGSGFHRRGPGFGPR